MSVSPDDIPPLITGEFNYWMEVSFSVLVLAQSIPVGQSLPQSSQRKKESQRTRSIDGLPSLRVRKLPAPPFSRSLRHFSRYDDRFRLRCLLVCATGSVLDVGVYFATLEPLSHPLLILTDLVMTICVPSGAYPLDWGSFPPWPSSFGG
jgi:hypothetical protein